MKIRYFYIVSLGDYENKLNSFCMNFINCFNLVEAQKEADMRTKGSILLSWQEVTEKDFFEYTDYCNKHELCYKPKLAVVEKIKELGLSPEPQTRIEE